MLALHHILRRHRHVVAEVVKTEFIICTKCDVAGVCPAARRRVRLMLVDAVYRLTVEHVQGAHPLRVTFRQIVVDSHYMNASSCKRAQEHREGRHEGFSFTGCHLRNLALM